MLYEVITPDRYSAGGRVELTHVETREKELAHKVWKKIANGEDFYAAMKPLVPGEIHPETIPLNHLDEKIRKHRITSYNVCYTKLLRSVERNGKNIFMRAGALFRGRRAPAPISGGLSVRFLGKLAIFGPGRRYGYALVF